MHAERPTSDLPIALPPVEGGEAPLATRGPGKALAWLWAVAALVTLASASPAWARSHHVRIPGPGQRADALRHHLAKLKELQGAPQTGHSVVLGPGILAALDGPQLAGPAARIRVSDPEWLANHAARVPGRPDVVRCDLCTSSASEFQPGEAVIVAPVDVRSWTNRFTTLKISDATVKITSLSPLGLQLRKSF